MSLTKSGFPVLPKKTEARWTKLLESCHGAGCSGSSGSSPRETKKSIQGFFDVLSYYLDEETIGNSWKKLEFLGFPILQRTHWMVAVGSIFGWLGGILDLEAGLPGFPLRNGQLLLIEKWSQVASCRQFLTTYEVGGSFKFYRFWTRSKNAHYWWWDSHFYPLVN